MMNITLTPYPNGLEAASNPRSGDPNPPSTWPDTKCLQHGFCAPLTIAVGLGGRYLGTDGPGYRTTSS